MKRASLFRQILSVAFAATIVFTVSIHEVHYLFAQHEAREHCENHLHKSNQDDCAICKFDVSFFTDNVFSPLKSLVSFIEVRLIAATQSFKFQSLNFNLPSRAPPATA